MQKVIETNNQSLGLNITIICDGKKSFRVWGEKVGKKHSKYADRVINVEGSRTIVFGLPASPDKLFVGCLNINNPKDTSFQVIIQEVPLKTYDIHLDAESKQFVELATKFSQVCGFSKASRGGTMYSTRDKYFNIKYFDIIRDYQSGTAINTPARIGHNTGIIEVSQVKFIKYTIPMRMMILLHEFSHKYRNPKIGLRIDNEVGADINALYIYLGLGFSKVDAICVFANVFLKAQTDANIIRMRKILDYIQKFENQEYAQLN